MAYAGEPAKMRRFNNEGKSLQMKGEARNIYQRRIPVEKSHIPALNGNITKQVPLPTPSQKYLLDQLADIKRLLEYANRDKYSFVNAFPVWHSYRKQNICTLNKIASHLEMVQISATVGKIVGTTMQIAGAALTIGGAGFGLSYLGMKTATVGTGIKLSCDVAEPILNRKMLNDACVALEKDREEYERLGRYFKYPAELKKATKLFGRYSIFEDVVSGIKAILSQKRPASRSAQYLKQIYAFFNPGYENSYWISEMECLPFMKKLKCKNSNVYGVIMAIVSDEVTRSLLIELVETFKELKPVLDTIWKLMPRLSCLFPIVGNVAKYAIFDYSLCVATNPVCCAALIALETFLLLKLATKLQKPSEHAEEIRNISKYMSRELKNLEEIDLTLLYQREFI